ncbi:GlcG/HbpS family heme-binding protein [Sphingopyxis kveilinensis]|uniref:GlcG/HbpS family heme-binding protein n=1 Tax=Sphingopyxis kveilinensis TaxID=3114367 RepID=UPI0030D0122B
MMQVPTLDAADAKILVEAAVAISNSIGVPQNIAVVDAAGALLAFHRMDGAKPFTGDFAIAKAATAAGLRVATTKLAEIALPGQRGFGLDSIAGSKVAILGGGEPVSVAGQVVGAIGISSGSVHEDTDVARGAVARFGAHIVDGSD